MKSSKMKTYIPPVTEIVMDYLCQSIMMVDAASVKVNDFKENEIDLGGDEESNVLNQNLWEEE